MTKPTVKPQNPCFSSGPCAKRPGWTLDALSGALLGRSHRAAKPKAQLQSVIEQHRKLLNIPSDYKIAIMAGSDTGAFEGALWHMLGERGVDVFAWEAFGTDWLKDITDQLKLSDVKTYTAPYGQLPDLTKSDASRDIIFTWNGTTSGARVPNGDWLKSDRTGLTFCDATSAVFAYDLPWDKLDVTTWSWQKVLGSEGAHGMLVLSPRAIERLENYKPAWGLPKLFRLTAKGKVTDAVFEGATINTPSMLCVADVLDALNWVEKIGGLPATMQRSRNNFSVIETWIALSPWAAFLVDEPDHRSITSVCLKITDPWFVGLAEDAQQSVIKDMVKMLESENAAYDVAAYRDAPAGLRIWCGATVDTTDIEKLLPWLDWAFAQSKSKT